MKYPLCVVAAITFLSACGGGGGGGGSWNALANQAVRLDQEWLNTEYTEDAQMPQSGTATYRGVAEYGDGEVLSSAEMRANFADATISGRLHNFQSIDRTPISGQVAIRDGEITGADYRASLAGELTSVGERAAITGDVYGSFSGPRAEIVDGDIFMTVETDDLIGSIEGFMVLKQ